MEIKEYKKSEIKKTLSDNIVILMGRLQDTLLEIIEKDVPETFKNRVFNNYFIQFRHNYELYNDYIRVVKNIRNFKTKIKKIETKLKKNTTRYNDAMFVGGLSKRILQRSVELENKIRQEKENIEQLKIRNNKITKEINKINTKLKEK